MKKENGNNFFPDDTSKIKSKNIFGRYKDAWIEDTFHFESIQGRNTPLPKTGDHMGSSLTRS
ncbi:hypothetical protein KJ641_00970, partial [Patescibacteria group bacterium]|nr:hypothetical protein [Patescibacteria group bacterium]MBU1895430.1 hypothetical protein [Patescibacteria group bacterium]